MKKDGFCRFYKNLYWGESVKRHSLVKWKLRHGSGQFTIFCIVRAMEDADQLDIIHNAFLQQATKLTKDGVMFFPAADANFIQAVIQSVCDSVIMDFQFSNEGSTALNAPYGLTVYKDIYRGVVLHTRTFQTDLEPKDTMTVHLSFKNSDIEPYLPIERYVVTINDIGTGIEKEGGQQEDEDQEWQERLLRLHHVVLLFR